MGNFKDFIPENTLPAGVKRIGIYNQNQIRVGQISPGNLLKDKGRKQYAFGALADVHVPYETAVADLRRTLAFLNKAADFVCICGDLTSDGTSSELSAYKQHIDQVAGIPVHTAAGNHEGRNPDLSVIWENSIGTPLYYSFLHNNDVFIMLGIKSDTAGSLFAEGELQWLYETLEANRNKRCFLFQHVRPEDGCGNAMGIYTYDIWGGTEQVVFESLLRHYPNVIFFHGHSHLKFCLQKYRPSANLDQHFGCWSVHIPSLAVPRDTDGAVNPSIIDVYADAEGYVVDVYEKGIHLRGFDFVKNKAFPIASYWLDTTLQTVAPGTYEDSTKTIRTASD